MADYEMRYDNTTIQQQESFLRSEISKGNLDGLLIFKRGKKMDITGLYTRDSEGHQIIDIKKCASVVAQSMANMFSDHSGFIEIEPRPGTTNEFSCCLDNDE